MDSSAGNNSSSSSSGGYAFWKECLPDPTTTDHDFDELDLENFTQSIPEDIVPMSEVNEMMDCGLMGGFPGMRTHTHKRTHKLLLICKSPNKYKFFRVQRLNW